MKFGLNNNNKPTKCATYNSIKHKLVTIPFRTDHTK